MKILKHLFIIFASLFITNISYAGDITLVNSQVKTTSCNGANVSEVFYIDGNNISKYIYDTFWTIDDRVISKDNTKVTIWQSDSNLLSGCNTATTWHRPSFLSPGNNQRVIAIGANCTFNKPTDKDKRFLQFVYNIGYYDISSTEGLLYPYSGDFYYYTSYSNLANAQADYRHYDNVGFVNLQIHDNECFNIELRYCGDGIVDTQYGEECDPEDPNTSLGCNINTCTYGDVASILVDKTDDNPNDLDGGVEDSQLIDYTTDAVFKITVTNNGTEPLKNVYLVDTVYDGLQAAVDCNKSEEEVRNILTSVGNGDDVLDAGETFSYTCSRANNPEDYSNNRVGYINSITVYGISTISGNSVSDSDTTEVLLNQVCGDGILQAPEQCDDGNNISGDGCSATCELEGTPYCGDGILQAPEQCDDGNNISGDGCSATCAIEGGGGGGGIGAICYDIEVSGNQVTCYGNSQVESFMVDCGNGSFKFASALNNDSIVKGIVTCDYSIDNNGDGIPDPKVSEPRCYVSGLALNLIPDPKENYSGWYTRNQCQATIGQVCGNGILEGNEECEKDESGNWPSICNTDCTLKTPGVTTVPGEEPGVITIPNHGNIIFGERANVIIYKGQSVGEKVPTPYIKNDSDYDLNLKSICVVQTSGDTLTRPAIQPNCKTLPNILYPGQKVEFPGAYDEYIGKEVPEGQDYGDNELKITYQNHAGQIFDWAYFAETVKVRVAKPSIMTVGGGTSFVKDTRNISDINNVADGVIDSTKVDDNKNFVGTSVSSLDSLAEKTTDSNIIDKVEITGSGYENNIKEFSTTVATSPSSTIVTLNDRETYNGMKNVYIFKDKSLRVDDENILNSLFSGPITFIIENGNLYIDKNIVYNDNLAFVVKGGDIIIKDSVTRIDGTYITIRKGTNGGKFISTGETAETLVINGAIYGNIDDLVSKRVNFENNNGNLSVGTVVSFGSALFKKPAPLVSQFIEEYLEQQKVAQ